MLSSNPTAHLFLRAPCTADKIRQVTFWLCSSELLHLIQDGRKTFTDILVLDKKAQKTTVQNIIVNFPYNVNDLLRRFAITLTEKNENLHI